ncbi:MAG: hypothetical protein GTO14_10485 [Anaerolineales bacterium]|nr:hypothetical protein [Anaerolineales bacterium]
MHTIDDPTGKPAFFFARIAYVDDVEEIFLERQKPVEEDVEFEGQSLRVLHSRLDAGMVRDLFDGNFETLVRGERANPFVLEIHLPKPQNLRGLRLTVGSMADFTVTVRPAPADGSGGPEFVRQFVNLEMDPVVEIPFSSETLLTSSLRIEILDNQAGPEAKIHVREVSWY